MMTISQNCTFIFSMPKCKERCEVSCFYEKLTWWSRLSENKHVTSVHFCAPNVKPELKLKSFIKFCTSWLCPVDLGPNWMAEMPYVWFHSCYGGKIFSTFEIFFHLCFNGNWGLQKMPCSLRMEQYTPWLRSTLGVVSAQQLLLHAPSQQSMKGIWSEGKSVRYILLGIDCSLISGSQPIPCRDWSSNLPVTSYEVWPLHHTTQRSYQVLFRNRNTLAWTSFTDTLKEQRLRGNLMRESELGEQNMGHRGSVFFCASCRGCSWQVWLSVW